MHAGPEIAVALMLCFTLVVGAAMRMISGRVHVPYTIAMLIVGLATGLALERLSSLGLNTGALGLLEQGSAVSPELIIFIFLPILIFESAFALEVHTFRKNLGAVVMLAGPAMLASAAATGVLAVGLTAFSWHWGWMAALVFGALISATDPVAVVALLRETGAPKRLGLVIEGESLLNDGTAIVVFTVLLGLLTGEYGSGAGAVLFHFLWVTGGGLVVGLVLAIGVTAWLSRTFNAPLIEITLTLVLAYASMLIAEGFLHVSGVIAVVTAGLWMSGRGRLQISPEVTHFLHRFWEMLAYLANTLIFFLVGLVIATQVGDSRLMDLVVIATAYAGIVALRFALTFAFRPLMNRVADPLGVGETAVLAWGGLRGAVSLALALVVSQHPDVSPELGRQILLATAGVVLLTILVNGSSMGWLLHRLGFDQPPAGDRLAEFVTRASVLGQVSERIATVSDSSDLRTVNWVEVRQDLEHREASLRDQIGETRRELEAGAATERARGYWRQALSMERESFWAAFSQGTLGAQATRILDHEIDVQLDRLAQGESAPESRRTREPPSWRGRLARWLSRPGRVIGGLEFDLITLRYDLYRGEQLAAERVLADLEAGREVDHDVRGQIRASYQGYLRSSKERLEDLRIQLPEVTRAIETRLARRIQLNFERDRYTELAHTGAIDPLRASEALADVERQMKALTRGKRQMTLPETGDLVRDAPLFQALDDDAMTRIAELTNERVFGPEQILFRQGDRADRMFIIARGAVAVTREIADGGSTRGELLGILGGGDIIGEMSLLTGGRRIATARSITTVIVGEIAGDELEQLMAAQPRLHDGIWQSFAERAFDNELRRLPGYEHLGRDDRLRWFRLGTVASLDADQALPAGGAEFAFVVTGTLQGSDRTYRESAFLSLHSDASVRTVTASRVALLPAYTPTASG